MNGTGHAHGALTVVNAIPTGHGAAIGLELETRATVDVHEEDGPLDVRIQDTPEADTSLAHACVDAVAAAHDTTLSGRVRTESQIPIARGLKSSSVAANAITLALLDALDEPRDPDTVLQLSVQAAHEAGVTVTGALDDAAASLHGGLVVTDNRKNRVLHREPLNKDHAVVCLVPSEHRPTRTVDALDQAAPAARACLDLVDQGDWPAALTLNGLAIAAALDEPTDPAYRALNAGAHAAGLTGTGPAIGALVPPDATQLIRRAWEPYTAQGTGIIETRTRTPSQEDPA